MLRCRDNKQLVNWELLRGFIGGTSAALRWHADIIPGRQKDLQATSGEIGTGYRSEQQKSHQHFGQRLGCELLKEGIPFWQSKRALVALFHGAFLSDLCPHVAAQNQPVYLVCGPKEPLRGSIIIRVKAVNTNLRRFAELYNREFLPPPLHCSEICQEVNACHGRAAKNCGKDFL